VFVKIRTACGIEGVGEAYAATFSPHIIAAMAEDLFARVFAGQDPMQVETLWRKAYGAGFTLRPDVSLMGVLSALEMACWDITGKALEQPIYKLLGGLVNPRLRSYTYLYPGRERRRLVLRRPGQVRPSAPPSMSNRASPPSSSTRSAATRCSTRASPRWSAWTCRSVSAS
jgi:L-alanine-DL-glutamate epimerase-like enolase superfamily enzyme